ncbi:unnamed protein product [Adineta steineri]|uniref:RRM domain-containing protein n=1 Tax=Adineta steineri TaxID=433720 RepID=A0A819ABJ2_9BILA|nr:unnamed protein product [Adineta steineri]
MSDRQVFIGNLCNISTDVLRTYCEKYGLLTELSVNRDKENNVYHCFAFVTYQFSRSISQFMSNRPHFINGEEIFVKRALPRSTSSIPERLIVTNRLISQDLYKYDKNLLKNYFQKYGNIKKIDIENGYIDFEDYDDVDRVLLARPHYIRDKEVSVTKFSPSEQQDNSDSHHIRSNNHRQRLHTNYKHRNLNNYEQPDRIIRTSPIEPIRLSCVRKLERNSSEITFINPQCNGNDEEEGEIDCSYSNNQYENLEEQYHEYKQAKELEICGLKMDLERTKRQLFDITQEKLDLLVKNQQLYHNQLLLRLFPDNTSISTQTTDDLFPSTPDHISKKRKLTTSPSISPIHREYDYYS